MKRSEKNALVIDKCARAVEGKKKTKQSKKCTKTDTGPDFPLFAGANRGVGLALVKAFHREGYQVWGTVRPQTMNDDSIKDLLKTGAEILPLDFTDEKTIVTAAETLGNTVECLDVLVNSGGVNTKPRQWNGGETGELIIEKFKIMAVGPLLATMHFLPLLQKSQLGKVLNISSDLASITNTDGGRLSYRMAKASLKQQTASLAADFGAAGIDVALVAVHPGRVPTRMSGGNGSVDLAESAAGMVRIVNELDMQSSGRFLDHTGAPMAW